MSPDLEMTLLIFLIVAIVVTLLVGVFLVLWLINLNKLTTSLTENSEIFRMELKPIFEEVHSSLQKVNSMLSTADTNVGRINKVVVSVLGVLGLFLSNFKNLSGGFMKGIFQGFKVFAKK